MKNFQLCFWSFEGNIVGADPSLIGAKRWIAWQEVLKSHGIILKDEESNLIDQIWTEENGRPKFEVLTYDIVCNHSDKLLLRY